MVTSSSLCCCYCYMFCRHGHRQSSTPFRSFLFFVPFFSSFFSLVPIPDSPLPTPELAFESHSTLFFFPSYTETPCRPQLILQNALRTISSWSVSGTRTVSSPLTKKKSLKTKSLRTTTATTRDYHIHP